MQLSSLNVGRVFSQPKMLAEVVSIPCVHQSRTQAQMLKAVLLIVHMCWAYLCSCTYVYTSEVEARGQDSLRRDSLGTVHASPSNASIGQEHTSLD